LEYFKTPNTSSIHPAELAMSTNISMPWIHQTHLCYVVWHTAILARPLEREALQSSEHGMPMQVVWLAGISRHVKRHTPEQDVLGCCPVIEPGGKSYQLSDIRLQE